MLFPENALFPVQSGAGKLHVHVHDPIDAQGKSEEELSSLVREAFIKTLPLEQHPLEQIPSGAELQAMSEEKQSTSAKNDSTVGVWLKICDKKKKEHKIL